MLHDQVAEQAGESTDRLLSSVSRDREAELFEPRGGSDQPRVPVPELSEKEHVPGTERRLPLTDAEVLRRTDQLWREVEPVDLTDPVPHVYVSQLVASNGTQLIAASRRGRGHAQDGKYRDDAVLISEAGEWLIAVVADGTGSRTLARVGARLSSEAAVAYLQATLQERISMTEVEIARLLRRGLAGAMVQALTAICAEAVFRNRPIDDFATTLILLLYRSTPDYTWLGVGQVGDGGIVVELATGAGELVTQPDRGRAAGESVFLTSQEAQLTWPKRVFAIQVREPIRRVVVGTDGVIDDFTPPLGALADLVQSLSPIDEATDPVTWLVEWLGYRRRGSFDDRTLVVLTPGPPCQPSRQEV